MSELKATDLKKGNLLEHGTGAIYAIDGVLHDVIYYAKMHHDLIETFAPVPITPELLASAGFANPKEYLYVIMAKQNQFALIPMKAKYMVSLSGPFGLVNLGHIEFLHELQNLFYSITGTELTLKPNESE